MRDVEELRPDVFYTGNGEELRGENENPKAFLPQTTRDVSHRRAALAQDSDILQAQASLIPSNELPSAVSMTEPHPRALDSAITGSCWESMVSVDGYRSHRPARCAILSVKPPAWLMRGAKRLLGR